ncbi:MAG TPA: hypothetical protein VM638_00345, partial [Actinomycetota bacterium]|nr:hypothetical protein [Actinomycetota bacterium]
MRSRLPLLLLLSLLGPIAPVAAEGEVSGSATLAISPTTARAGRTIALNGALEVAEPCLAGRAVVIEHLPATGAGWGSVAATATSADGSFLRTVLAQENGSFRARITAEERDGVACAEVVSPSVGVAVRAFVTARFPRPRLGAGGCAPLAIEVLPPKPGQAVAVELRSGGSWTPLATLTLDDASTASFPRCHGWRSIGETFELRATWQQQDLAHVAGASSAAVLEVVKASWMRRLDRLTDGTSVSISVRDAFTTFRTAAE